MARSRSQQPGNERHYVPIRHSRGLRSADPAARGPAGPRTGLDRGNAAARAHGKSRPRQAAGRGSQLPGGYRTGLAGALPGIQRGRRRSVDRLQVTDTGIKVMGLGIVIDSPANGASVSRSFTITGRAIVTPDVQGQETGLNTVQVTFGTNGPSQSKDFNDSPNQVNSWQFTGAPFDTVAPSSTLTVTVSGQATFTLITIVNGKPHRQVNKVSTSATVNVVLPAAIPPVPIINAIPTPTLAASLPLQMTFSGNVNSPEAPVTSLQYNVSHGQVDPNQFHNVSVGPSPWKIGRASCRERV